MYLHLPGVMHIIHFGVPIYYVLLKASGKTASATQVSVATIRIFFNRLTEGH